MKVIGMLLVLLVTFLVACSPTQTLTDESGDYILEARESSRTFVSAPTEMYLFNDAFPGPLIEGVVGEPLSVIAKNSLGEPITIHFHGMQLPNGMDGVPDVTQEAIAPGESFVYEFTPINPGTYWYHSHVDAHKQVEMGLQGAVIIREADNPVLAQSETVLVIDDIMLDQDGSFRSFAPNYMHGRFGNVLLVNGQRYPEITIGGSEHRFRIINTANARSFVLSFANNPITIIGEDIGYVTPYNVSQVTIHPGERYDVLVSFDEDITLTHQSRGTATPLALLRTATMVQSQEYTHNFQPSGEELPSEAWTMEPTMELSLQGVRASGYGLVWQINGSDSLTNPQTITLQEGELVKMRLTNTQGQPHPMHLHGQKFIVTKDNQRHEGFKDTVMVDGFESVDIAFMAEEKGEWVFHCHILEHAKAGMLTKIEVV